MQCQCLENEMFGFFPFACDYLSIGWDICQIEMLKEVELFVVYLHTITTFPYYTHYILFNSSALKYILNNFPNRIDECVEGKWIQTEKKTQNRIDFVNITYKHVILLVCFRQ